MQDQKGRILLERRPPSGIWGGLWSLPECTEDNGQLPDCSQWGVDNREASQLTPFSHTFSHFRLHITPWLIPAGKISMAADRPQRWDSPKAWLQAGLPAPIKKLLNQLQ